MFSIIANDLFKSIERLCRSGKRQIDSKPEEIIVLGILRKKYLTRCQFLRSKRLSKYSLTKFFFNIVKFLFKSIERLCRKGKMQIASKKTIYIHINKKCFQL